jgi:uncharacterized FlaG/YvyC family protein
MDTGLTIRPTGAAAQQSSVRPEPAPARQTVATELAPSQSVTASANSAAARNDEQKSAALQAQTTREIVLDPHSREVIFRVRDERSGRVVRQVPDEALLRLRAYQRAIADGEAPLQAAANDLQA